MIDLESLSYDELTTLQMALRKEIRKRTGKPIGYKTNRELATKMPEQKRHYSYTTLTTLSEYVVRRIADEWWGIITWGISKANLIEMIQEKQELELIQRSHTTNKINPTRSSN